MSSQIFQQWFNLAPDGISTYFTDKKGQKFWFEWVEGLELYLHVTTYGRWVGKVEAEPTGDGGLDLIDIFVVDRRLRGCGVGSEMMKCLIKKARERNVRYIWGAIVPDEYTTKEYLIQFYRKHGFAISEDEKGDHSILLKLKG